jgi:quercetin dioxygenase-like cupin family protein
MKIVRLAAATAILLLISSGPEASPGEQPAELPQLVNSSQLHWVKTIPSAGDRSPEYAILHVDPKTNLTLLMFRTPVDVHIKRHTHPLAETHIVLKGSGLVFQADGVRYTLNESGYFRMPGGTVHEAWLPAGSVTLNIEESGWTIDWLDGEPSNEDLGQNFPQ